LHDIQSHLPQHGGVVRAVAQQIPGLILVPNDVQPSVQAISTPQWKRTTSLKRSLDSAVLIR
jgi:hypothetical protein